MYTPGQLILICLSFCCLGEILFNKVFVHSTRTNIENTLTAEVSNTFFVQTRETKYTPNQSSSHLTLDIMYAML